MSDQQTITYFAETDFRGKKTPFGIKREDRSRHMYVIGKTGMGKSTLLENMAIQDIKNGEGFCFIDPHGKSADLLLDYVPEERIKDVIYFAPFDLDHPIAFNVMEDVGKDQRHLVASGLMSTFEKIWVDAWSARMSYILNNTILALLEYPGATLLGVNRMLSDKIYRNKVVANISDPSVKTFWTDEFAKYTERFAAEATPAIQNKVGQFTSNPLIRNIIGQPKSSFDFRAVMDQKKIMIINLSKGQVGEQNANLLGGMLITKIYLAALSRSAVDQATLRQLPPFYLYVDEFQSFANKTFENILSESRKYKLSLILAHQYIEQMEEEVRNAVFGNVGTTVAFRVGPFDAEVLENIFLPKFTKEDLVNLGRFQMYLTLMIDGVGSPPFSARALPPIPALAVSNKSPVIEGSREHYTRPRAGVEAEIIKWYGEDGKTGLPGLPPGEGKDRPAVKSRAEAPAPKPTFLPPRPKPVITPWPSEPVKAAAPAPAAKPAAPMMSLKKLAPKTEEAAPKHREQLKAALQEILKATKTPPAKSTPAPETEVKAKAEAAAPQASKPAAAASNQTKSLSAEELERLLKVPGWD